VPRKRPHKIPSQIVFSFKRTDLPASLQHYFFQTFSKTIRFLCLIQTVKLSFPSLHSIFILYYFFEIRYALRGSYCSFIFSASLIMHYAITKCFRTLKILQLVCQKEWPKGAFPYCLQCNKILPSLFGNCLPCVSTRNLNNLARNVGNPRRSSILLHAHSLSNATSRRNCVLGENINYACQFKTSVVLIIRVQIQTSTQTYIFLIDYIQLSACKTLNFLRHKPVQVA
jgi:hypothetical protein